MKIRCISVSEIVPNVQQDRKTTFQSSSGGNAPSQVQAPLLLQRTQVKVSSPQNLCSSTCARNFPGYFKIFRNTNLENIPRYLETKTHANCGGWFRLDLVNIPALLAGTIGTWDRRFLWDKSDNQQKPVLGLRILYHLHHPGECSRLATVQKLFTKPIIHMTLTCPRPLNRLTTLVMLPRSKSRIRPAFGVSWLRNRSGRETRRSIEGEREKSRRLGVSGGGGVRTTAGERLCSGRGRPKESTSTPGGGVNSDD